MDAIIRANAENTDRIMKNAKGYVVSNNTYGTIATSSYDNTVSVAIVKLICCDLVAAAKSAVRDIDATNDLKFLRIATRKSEYLIAPEKEFTIVVEQ